MSDPPALTPEQIEALRLVQQNLSSKEIARFLGISARAVDQRLDRARLALGASSRRDAARRLAEIDGAYDRLTRDPAEVVYPPSAAALMTAAGGNEPDLQRVQTTRSEYGQEAPTERGIRQLLRRIEPDDITTSQRIGLTVIIAVAVPMMFGGLSLLLYAVVAVGRIFLR